MSCEIDNYSVNDNIDISVKKENINYILAKKPITIYIVIQESISTTTLKPGYISRGGCSNMKYSFTIKNNIISGYKIEEEILSFQIFL